MALGWHFPCDKRQDRVLKRGQLETDQHKDPRTRWILILEPVWSLGATSQLQTIAQLPGVKEGVAGRTRQLTAVAMITVALPRLPALSDGDG